MSDAPQPSTGSADASQARLSRRRAAPHRRRGSRRCLRPLRRRRLGTQRSSSIFKSAAAGSVTFGSNASDPVPKKAYAQRLQGVHREDRDQGQGQHRRPQHVPGADQHVPAGPAAGRLHLVRRLPHAVLRRRRACSTPIDDVWADAEAAASRRRCRRRRRALDGHYYFVPIYNYPWAVFYRKSVFKKNGYTIPKTWDQFIALAKKMKADGLTPIAFTDKDGWPAMGTFDILNMRLNGYDFHVRLMAGKAVVGQPAGQAASSTTGASSCRTPRRAPSGSPGRKAPSSCSTSRPACTCSARSSGQQFTNAGRPRRPRLLRRTRRSTRSGARTRSTRRSTAS